jgi:hypothetical protein
VEINNAIFQAEVFGVDVRMGGRTIRILCVVALACAIASCWIVPWRLAFGPGGSYYTFGYLNDEYNYAQRIQPLLDGATATNPINGVCDPCVHSQFFLEDACRLFLSLTGIGVVSFMWAWRLLSPLIIVAFTFLLARECLPRSRPPWGPALRLAAGIAALPLLYCLYYVLMEPKSPPFAWLNRIPTNVEYLLSAFLIWSYVAFLRRLTRGYGLLLAIGAVALVYLRLYTAIPWALAILASVLYLAVTRRISLRLLFSLFAAVALGLTPWLLIALSNRHNPVWAAMMTRYFIPRPYEVHAKWATYVAVACVLAISARFVTRARVFLLSSAFAMFALPSVCAIPRRIRNETLLSDRYGCFYLFSILAAGMLLLGEYSRSWRGQTGLRRGTFSAVALLGVAFLGCAAVSTINWRYDFVSYQPGQLASVIEDQACLHAYDWVREHTPPSALFLVDDGFDWAQAPADAGELREFCWLFQCNNDLFQFNARRRRVYTELLYGNALSDSDLKALQTLQRGTFGFNLPRETYMDALKRFLPEYVFWRKHLPVIVHGAPPAVPRGFGKILRPFAEVVYEDDACEIWKLDYSAASGFLN